MNIIFSFLFFFFAQKIQHLTDYLFKIHSVCVYDDSNERRDADHLYNHMIEVINMLQDDWHITVAAITSDASGESRKARSMIARSHPSIVTPDCYAHQVSVFI